MIIIIIVSAIAIDKLRAIKLFIIKLIKDKNYIDKMKTNLSANRRRIRDNRVKRTYIIKNGNNNIKRVISGIR